MNNPLSFSSAKLNLFSRDDVRLKPATGFVVETSGKYYLITNRHVVAEHEMQSYLLKTSIHIYGGEGEHHYPLSWGMWKRLKIQLYDDHGMPTWMECKTSQQTFIDIIALPLYLDDLFRVDQTLRLLTAGSLEMDTRNKFWSRVSAISISAIDTDVQYAPPDTVHIVGYPLSWAPAGTDKSSAAFWRTSSIASEIHETNRVQENVFFIDPCAPEGMTGSPVVGMKNDRMKLLGVYSDSSTVEFGANAGLVWDALVLKKLLNA